MSSGTCGGKVARPFRTLGGPLYPSCTFLGLCHGTEEQLIWAPHLRIFFDMAVDKK